MEDQKGSTGRPAGISGLKEGRDASTDAALVSGVAEVFNFIEKALRSFGMYESDHKIPTWFRSTVAERLTALAEEHHEVWIEVHAKQICVGESVVYSENVRTEGFVFRLHRDGIRRICFSQGLTAEEVDRLLQILAVDLSGPEYFDSDMVTLLWDAELEHIRYIAADMLAEMPDDDESLRRYRDLMNDIIAAATMEEATPELLKTDRDPRIMRIARDALSDLNPEKVAAAVTATDEATGVDPYSGDGWIARLAGQYDDPLVLPKFSEILFHGMVQSIDEEKPDGLTTFDLLVQALLKNQMHIDLLSVLRHVRSLVKNSIVGSVEASEEMLRCLVQTDRIPLLVQALEDEEVEAASIQEVLRLFPSEYVPDVLAAGARLSKESRMAVVRVLVEMGAGRPDLLSRFLKSDNPLEVDMAFRALVAIGTDSALAHLTPLREHPNPNMRLALLKATMGNTSPVVRKAKRALLGDEKMRVRATAEAILAGEGDPELTRQLRRRLTGGLLNESPFVEKRRVCETLGAYGGEGEISILVEILSGAHVFSGKNNQELAVAAAYGIGATRRASLAEVLKRQIDRRLSSKRVRAACREALRIIHSPPSDRPRPIRDTADIGGDAATPAGPADSRPGVPGVLDPSLETPGVEQQVELPPLEPLAPLPGGMLPAEPVPTAGEADDLELIDVDSPPASPAIQRLLRLTPPPVPAVGPTADAIAPDSSLEGLLTDVVEGRSAGDSMDSSQELDDVLREYLDDKPTETGG